MRKLSGKKKSTMVAPYSNSEKKASPHAKTFVSVRGLQRRVPRADLRQAAFDAERLEPGQRPETLAEIASPWPVLRNVLAQACAHTYGQRFGCLRAWPFIRAIVPSFFLRTQKSAFGKRWSGSLRRHKAQATWAHDLRPIRLTRLPGLFLSRLPR